MSFAELSEALAHLAEPAFLYMAGAVIILAGFLSLLLRRQPRNIVAYATEEGRVFVSRSAITELVQTSCEQLDDVARPSVRIRARKHRTDFQVHLKLRSGGRMRAIEQTLQRHLRQTLTENLGIENLGRIDIVATGFKSGRIEGSKIPSKPENTEPEESNPELEFEETVETTKSADSKLP